MTSTAAIALNITSLIGTIFMSLICIIMLCVLFRRIIQNGDIVLILAANNYLALLAFALTSIIINIDMLRGDFNFFVGQETLGCLIEGYILYVFSAAIFNTFTLQAAFRFFRVVYPSHVWLQRGRVYALIVPIMWIISFLLILPVHIWHDVKFVPMENACFITIDTPRGIIWITVIIYSLPMNIIGFIYMQLMRFIRRSPMIASVRTKRDVLVIRRIVLVVSVLLLIGIPSVVMEIMLPFTNIGKPLFYRISDLSMVTAMTALSILLIYVTPQIKEILMHIKNQHQIVPTQTQQRTGLAVATTQF